MGNSMPNGNRRPGLISLGFSLIELLVVIAIIGVLAGIITVATSGARVKARDVMRKSDLSRLGQLLYGSACYLPQAGAGDYDIADLAPELAAKYPQAANYVSLLPKDPKTGSDTQTRYNYIVSAGAAHCALYANLENADEPVTLPSFSAPTPGGGTGVLRGAAGWNGSDKYYQIGK